jgi:hypothetical protein
MLAELDVLVFLKSSDALDRVAERVFAALHTEPTAAVMDEPAGLPYYEGQGMGLSATLYENAGEMLDPEFEDFGFALQITSDFWDVDLDPIDLESGLGEFYARKLSYELNLETATEIFIESTEEVEISEIRSFRRNPQYVPDSGPTVARVYTTEARQVERPFDDQEWDDEEAGDEEEFAEDDGEFEDEAFENGSDTR